MKLKDIELDILYAVKEILKDEHYFSYKYGDDFVRMVLKECKDGIPENYNSYKFRPNTTYRLLEFEDETNLIKESLKYSKFDWRPDMILGKHTILLRKEGRIAKTDESVISTEHFVNCCKNRGFTDEDGFGYYKNIQVDGIERITNEYAWPSDIIEGRILGYPFVVWYNK